MTRCLACGTPSTGDHCPGCKALLERVRADAIEPDERDMDPELDGQAI